MSFKHLGKLLLKTTERNEMKACLTEFRLFLIDTNIGFLLELYSPCFYILMYPVFICFNKLLSVVAILLAKYEYMKVGTRLLHSTAPVGFV